MAMKAITVSFAIMLLILLAAVPCFATGRLSTKGMDTEVYVIDYRGPETHTYFPPPDRNKGRTKFHGKTRKVHHDSKVPNADTSLNHNKKSNSQVKKIHLL